MALKLYICVLSERHDDNIIELVPTEVLAMERGRQWLAHYSPTVAPYWEHDDWNKAWLHHGYIPNVDDGPRVRIVEVQLDLGLLSDHESETLVKVMGDRRVLCETCNGTGVYPFAPDVVCEECRGGGSVKR